MDAYEIRKTEKNVNGWKPRSRGDREHKTRHTSIEKKRLKSERRFALRRLKASVQDLLLGIVHQCHADFRIHDKSSTQRRRNAPRQTGFVQLQPTGFIARLDQHSNSIRYRFYRYKNDGVDQKSSSAAAGGALRTSTLSYELWNAQSMHVGNISVQEMKSQIAQGAFSYAEKNNTLLYNVLPPGVEKPSLSCAAS